MNYGFFSTEELSKYKDTSYKTKKFNCDTCQLYKKCNTPKMEAEGKGRKKILIIGQSVSMQMDNKGTVYTGQSTNYLKTELKKHNIDIKRDCWKTNAVQCYTGTVKTKHINCCRERIIKEIQDKQPNIIILLGKTAVESVIGKYWKKNIGELSKWINWTIPDRNYNAWLCPMIHPSAIYNSKNKQSVKLAINKNISRVAKLINTSVPEFIEEENQVEILTDYHDIKEMFESLKKTRLAAFDYETTGLKPHAENHKIVCCSIASASDKSYSFMITNRIKSLLKEFLENDKIYKVAQNIKYEHNWSRHMLKAEVQGWVWDTMLGQHAFDSRRAITSLKFQSYIYYGIADYDSEIKPFLKSVDGTANGINRIDEIPKKDLLLYCGIDSLIEFKLAVMQMKLFGILDPLRYGKIMYRKK